MKALRALALLFSLSSYVLGQELITTVNQAGDTIVEQVTTNAFGQPLTQILQTLGPGTTSSTSPATTPTPATTPATTSSTTSPTTNAAVTTTPQVVGQPGTTPVTPGGPTPFVYTTTDANGVSTVVSATFTPSFPSAVPFTPTGTGTILQYSQWLSQIGTNTAASASQAANPASRASANIRLLSGTVLTSVLVGVIGGWMFIS